jgi:hypothetical protein
MTTTNRNSENTVAAKKARAAKTAETAKKIEKKDKTVLFVSSAKEIGQFDITVAGKRIHSFWDEARDHLAWRVPAELADRFAQHDFCKKGRIVRSEG